MEPDHWLGVELRHLAALEAVARTGTFGRAARELGYTQSAVSQQIQTLERLVGERLVDRPGGPRPVSLTDAGEVLLRHAAAITARLKAAQADIQALRAGELGTLRVGVYQSVGARVLPALMRRFVEAWPGVDLSLVEVNSDSEHEIAQRIERGDLDLAFWIYPLPDGPLEGVVLLADPFVAVAAADGPLGDRERVALDELAGLPLIGNQVCRTTALVDDALRTRGVEAHWAFRSDDNGTVQNLAASGLGTAIVARLAVNEEDERVRVLELDPPLDRRRIGIAWHRDRHRSPAARAFVELAQQVCAELQRELDAADGSG
jgi:molybdate transport repressor ModE-like protein